jgi:hypothetical protein
MEGALKNQLSPPARLAHSFNGASAAMAARVDTNAQSSATTSPFLSYYHDFEFLKRRAVPGDRNRAAAHRRSVFVLHPARDARWQRGAC